MQRVAQLAGVSTATVSRVVNNHPWVAPQTADNVRRAIQALNLPPLRPRGGGVRVTLRPDPAAATGTTIAMLVVGAPGTGAAPAFARLLEGVSAAITDNGFRLSFGFVSSHADLRDQLRLRDVKGVLLHGDPPQPRMQAMLRKFPAVWLMANRRRPTWGDQVMPDAAAAGEMAAKYLARHGHRHVAYLGHADPWSMRLRAFSFAQACADLGITARILQAADPTAPSTRPIDALTPVASALVDQLLALDPQPTGLFVGEDALLLPMQLSLRSRGNNRPFQIISCNNEQPRFAGLQARPAAIDLRPDAIGRLAVDQLLWRMRHRNVSEAVRLMVEPVLVEPAEQPNLT